MSNSTDLPRPASIGAGPATGTRSGTARTGGSRGSIFLGLAGGLLLASGGLGAGYYAMAAKDEAIITKHATPEPGRDPASAAAAKPSPSDASTAALGKAVAAQLSQEVQLNVSGQVTTVRWSDLGAVVDPDDLSFAAQRASGKDPVAALRAIGALPITLDHDRAMQRLLELKGHVDRSPANARMDLEAHSIVDDQPGAGLDVYAALASLEVAARTGAPSVELTMVPLPARVTKAVLGIDDISHVLGTWSTKFSTSDKDRNFNLKLAASKLDGHVIPAHGDFSFNETVGNRTEREGYKIAHVITAGEMVDGLAGGTCQISTTLFGASFFAGLEVDHVSNHSRPSAYQPIGFDATVVWPDTDLKMKNPYDFPVVIHYRVASGEAYVEVLGKQRPYDKVAFERTILEETPYPTEERLDDTMPEGSTTLDQAGFDGYKLLRTRKFYKAGKVVKEEKWTVSYKPVTEYVRKGTSTDPLAKAPEEKPIHGPQVPSDGTSRITQ